MTFHCSVTEGVCVRKNSGCLNHFAHPPIQPFVSSANIHVDAARLRAFSLSWKGRDVMKLGDILSVGAGLVAGAVVLAASVQAAPVAPLSGQAATVPAAANVEPAVVSQKEVDRMKPVLVHWHHHHWHHHHWHYHHHHM